MIAEFMQVLMKTSTVKTPRKRASKSNTDAEVTPLNITIKTEVAPLENDIISQPMIENPAIDKRATRKK